MDNLILSERYIAGHVIRIEYQFRDGLFYAFHDGTVEAIARAADLEQLEEKIRLLYREPANDR